MVTGFLLLSWVISALIILVNTRIVKIAEFRIALVAEMAEAMDKAADRNDLSVAPLAACWLGSMASYDRMLMEFWVWPLSKYRKMSCADFIQQEKAESMRQAVAMMMLGGEGTGGTGGTGGTRGRGKRNK